MNPARQRDLADAIAHRETAAAVAATPATTLGIPAGTIEVLRMRNGVRNYGEDRAAWQRVVASREPPGGTVGARLDTAATADGGLRLGRARIAHINERFLAANPTATDDQVCDNAANAHNPHNPLLQKVRDNFHRFQRERAAGAPPGPHGSLDEGGGDTRLAEAGPEPEGGSEEVAVASPDTAPGDMPVGHFEELPEQERLALNGLEDPTPGEPLEATEPTLAAKRLARSPAAPASPVPRPAGGAPTSATQDITAPTDPQAKSAQSGGSKDEWFDEVVRTKLGVTPPEGVDAYDWLTSTFVTVNVFGVTSGRSCRASPPSSSARASAPNTCSATS